MVLRPLFAVFLAIVADSALASPPTLEEVAKLVGLPTDAMGRVLAGEVVAAPLAASNEKDLGLVVAVRVDAPLEEVYAFVQTDELAQTQTVTLSSGTIDPRDPEAGLAELSLDPDTRRAFAADPAGTFQLSAAEAGRLGQAGEAKVLDVYRTQLVARARAYWERGLPGIEPYAGRGRSPADDLRAAHSATPLLSLVPKLEAELEQPPGSGGGAAEHQLHWALQKGRDQAAPVLFHRVLYRDADGEVFVERRFYSAYDYDALQIVAGVLPAATGGCVVFYLNRTVTAQVAGFGGSAKRSIGRKLLEQELVAELGRVQKALARPGS